MNKKPFGQTKVNCSRCDSPRLGKSQYCQYHDNIRRRAGTYSITIDEAERLLSIDHCESCGCSVDFGRGGKVIDHCHETGKIRGLLCDGCNQALGHLKDDLDKAMNLIKYIKERCQ